MSKKSPQLRFEGFTDDWEERKVKDIFKITRGQVLAATKTSEEKSDISPFPVYSSQTKNNGLMGYYKDYLFDTAITWTTDGANAGTVSYRSGRFYSTNVNGVLISDKGYTNKAISEILNLEAWKWVSHVGNPKLMNNVMGDISIMIPSSFEEQDRLSDFLNQLDDTIDLHQRKLDLLKEQKKGYLQKMFPKNGEKVPELRFAGFADDWEERKLSSGLREYTDRVIVEDDKEYYQISVRNNFGGITLRGSKMGNKIGRKRQAKINLTKYPQTLIFTRQTVEQGGIGWVDKYCDGAIVTENMPTISLDTSVFSKYFLTNLFQTRIFYKNAILDNVEGGSAQIAIHESKFLSSTLLFPNLDEQEKIGQFFKQLDNTITLHQRKLDLLKEQKKGFLQKMFV